MLNLVTMHGVNNVNNWRRLTFVCR